MGYPVARGGTEVESQLLAPTSAKAPADHFHVAYIVYFTLGTGFLLPWNAFITAVDYFDYLYPGVSVNRVFAPVYMLVTLSCLLIIVGWAHKSSARVRINLGLALFVVALLVVPIMDVIYTRGIRGLYSGYYVTVAAVALAGIADALVQGGVMGTAGELPERYMQATVAGTAASGVIVSLLRIVTKAIFPQDAHGLRSSANLYFGVSIVVMVICVVCYNVADRLPVIQYYNDLKMQAMNEEEKEKGSLGGSQWRSTLWEIVGRIKWFGFGIFLVYLISLSIYPGHVTADVHSQILKDWYPVLLITGYNVFDLIGKSLLAIYLIENANIAVAACIARLLFYPLFLACLHGPKIFRSEIPVTFLTCLLGLTNGYFSGVLMIVAPKTVPLQYSETVGIVLVLFLLVGLATGSIVANFWVF
ncbi:equilibrative nucleotide transporter 1-like [Aristolochia californica]|uniref:equilibrative nucleotide transporter 1-like n=1 Tax=Aristolochia californica TaxID=171875 RepID=UPI0035DE2AE0